MKKCQGCKIEKESSEFRKDHGRYDGRQAFCRACQNARNIVNKSLPKGRFQQLKAYAKSRSMEVGITLNEYEELIAEGQCYYCEGEINKGSGGYGLDRVDSKKGYELSNLVACCSVCNSMKKDLTTEEFYLHISRILKIRDLRREAN